MLDFSWFGTGLCFEYALGLVPDAARTSLAVRESDSSCSIPFSALAAIFSNLDLSWPSDLFNLEKKETCKIGLDTSTGEWYPRGNPACKGLWPFQKLCYPNALKVTVEPQANVYAINTVERQFSKSGGTLRLHGIFFIVFTYETFKGKI